MENVSTMKKSIPMMYFIATTAQMVGTTIAGSYLTKYMTDNLLLPVIMTGVVMMVARIVDLIIGVASGAIIQKTSLRFGQFRSWLLYAPILYNVGCTMCFINPNIPIIAKAVMSCVGYILYGTGMSFVLNAQNGMIMRIAGPNLGDRISISSNQIRGQYFGQIALSAITLPLITLVERNTNLDGYTLIQVIYACCSMAGAFILFNATREYDKFNPDFKAQGGGGSLVSMLIDTLKNGQLLILLAADILRWAAMTTLLTMALYYFMYVAKQPLMFATAMTIQSVLAFLCSFIAPRIVKKIGKRTAGIISGLTACAAYFCIAFFGVKGPYFYIAFNAIAVGGSSLIGASGVNLYLDCGEYQYYKTGKDNRTFVLSVFGIAAKLGFILTSAAVTYILTIAGYRVDPATNLGIVSDPVRFTMLLGSVPAIMNGIYAICLMVFRITDAKAKEYAEANHKKDQDAKAALASAAT